MFNSNSKYTLQHILSRISDNFLIANNLEQTDQDKEHVIDFLNQYKKDIKNRMTELNERIRIFNSNITTKRLFQDIITLMLKRCDTTKISIESTLEDKIVQMKQLQSIYVYLHNNYEYLSEENLNEINDIIMSLVMINQNIAKLDEVAQDKIQIMVQATFNKSEDLEEKLNQLTHVEYISCFYKNIDENIVKLDKRVQSPIRTMLKIIWSNDHTNIEKCMQLRILNSIVNDCKDRYKNYINFDYNYIPNLDNKSVKDACTDVENILDSDNEQKLTSIDNVTKDLEKILDSDNDKEQKSTSIDNLKKKIEGGLNNIEESNSRISSWMK